MFWGANYLDYNSCSDGFIPEEICLEVLKYGLLLYTSRNRRYRYPSMRPPYHPATLPGPRYQLVRRRHRHQCYVLTAGFPTRSPGNCLSDDR